MPDKRRTAIISDFRYRPIADVGNCCHPPLMIKRITLGLCLILASIASPAVGQDNDGIESLISVSGHLNAHWEYPNFVPDEGSELEIMDFQIREEKWQKTYFSTLHNEMMFSLEETICFRVIGQGFLAPRRPSYMQPWEGRQFIFVKIERLERLDSDEKCAVVPKTNAH